MLTVREAEKCFDKNWNGFLPRDEVFSTMLEKNMPCLLDKLQLLFMQQKLLNLSILQKGQGERQSFDPYRFTYARFMS